ncbi:hypothetical protein VOLCADRAFT_106678 [Volvox carteri f. nagariensis]|uniref:Pherophorin domain-containing protein n=1 Tax=Volvox carteri f. nagariensis TaxID=3068 RepID=D8U924_VOLCA|nr:uncharacterized protein VOLCADRAFT_106678 [Volvox carteri f. nagariensis]EFJ43674.1 hypothetical protein VOLCADRAFT_106678 [Volvox carteri f. nagariensis]|eukprot:XP_002955155.1 hypothetical protein VOLCADRAFT_106678 [Volvox carteri f. nagariensis]
MQTHAIALALMAVLAFVSNVRGEAGGQAPSAPKPSSPTYAMMSNFTGQWSISIFIRESPSAQWVPHTCNATAFGAACNRPVLTAFTNYQVMVNFTRKNASAPFRTWKNGTPQELVVRLDYAAASQVDRGWRKKNQAYPGHGWHAKWKLSTLSFTNSGVGIWDLAHADGVTDALLYPEVCTLCTFPDGHKDYCQCDRRNGVNNTLTIETAVVNSITPSMRGAAIAMSIFSPVFLIVYSISDSLYYKRTGRSLRFAH